MKQKKLSLSHGESVFGLDIGYSSLKVMEVDTSSKDKKPRVLGYGVASYPSDSINNGVIIKPEVLAKSMYDLFSSGLVGKIDSKKVACTVPTSRTFSRQMALPPMDDKDLGQAVQLEAEQYIPLHPNELYIDYEVSSRTNQGVSLLMVAVPKNIVDSYMRLIESVKLEPLILEPTINAVARIFNLAETGPAQPSILIDFGAVSTDMAVVVNNSMSVVNTVQGGANNITAQIAKQLKVSQDEAFNIKNEYGINYSDKRDQIRQAVQPILDSQVREIQKIIRYYEERVGSSGAKINQIVTIGGGATMPGLSEYISKELNLSARMLDPWQKLDFGQLPLPADSDRSMYITVSGAAVIDPEELTHD